MARTLNSTTLSATVLVDDKRVTLASNTTVKVGHLLFVDKEAMLVNGPGAVGSALVSGDIAEVQRGIGTKPSEHASGSKVWTGPGSDFSSIRPSGRGDTTKELVLPRIVLPEGEIYSIIDSDWVLNTGNMPTPSEGDFGTITQITSIATAVVVNARAGQITTFAAGAAAGAEDGPFTVTNDRVDANDVVIVTIKSYGGAGTPVAYVSAVAAGSFAVTLTNLHAANALNALIVLNFRVFKQASA